MGESKIVRIDHSRHIKRMLAEKRRKEIARRRVIIAAVAVAITLAVISVGVAVALAAGADESGIDESRGVIHFTDEPAPDAPIAGATAELWRIQKDARQAVDFSKEETTTDTSENEKEKDQAAGENPEIRTTELTAYTPPEEYESAYFPLDFQWYLIDLLTDLGIADEYPVAVAIYETESGYNPKATGINGDKGGFQVVEKYHGERMTKVGASDLYDIYDNAAVAMDYYAELLQEYGGDRTKALTAYNGGRGAVINGTSTEYARKVQQKADRIRQEMELTGKHYTRFQFAEDEI